MLKLSKFIKNYIGIILLLAWLIIQFCQAIVTPLHVDECYYWMFGQQLAWGYFDHPPGVALIIRISDWFFDGVLSVRFLTIITHGLSFIIIYQLFSEKVKILGNSFKVTSLLLALSLPLTHVYSFITTPDVPLIFSVVCFLWLYKKILETNGWIYWIGWGIAMALMLLSKYHGVLVIFFVVISNIRLLKKYRFYVACFTGFVCFLPHLIWQYKYDFVSFRFHLSERINEYEWFYPLEYIGVFLLIINPLFIGYFFKILKKIPTEKLERALYFVLIGFICFFFYQSFRLQIQAQWLLVIYIPFIILLMNNFGAFAQKYIRISFFTSLPLLLLGHIAAIIDIFPDDFNLHRQKEYVDMVKSDAEGLPVIFFSSYHRASIYSWYSDQKFTPSYNNARYRRNQFDIWQNDSIFWDKDVYFVGAYGLIGNQKKVYEGNYVGTVLEYKKSKKIEVSVLEYMTKNDSISAILQISNPYDITLEYGKNYFLNAYHYPKDLNYMKGELLSIPLHFGIVTPVLPYSAIEISMSWKVDSLLNYGHFGIATSEKSWPNGPIYKRYKLD